MKSRRISACLNERSGICSTSRMDWDSSLVFPPLAEQYRIVAKVDALMALCDALESRLKERAGVQGRLAGAVVKQVVGEV